jgi:Protein of unknown function (DUF2867)
MSNSKNPEVLECTFPFESALTRATLPSAFFRDSYRAPINQTINSNTDIPMLFFAVFGYFPWWMKLALLLRNFAAKKVGLESPSASDIFHPVIKPTYVVGDTIGPWPIFLKSARELIVGRDNRHLDFRLSLLTRTGDQCEELVISTTCKVHNRFGKIYLFFVVPFHKWGVKTLIRRAIQKQRL